MNEEAKPRIGMVLTKNGLQFGPSPVAMNPLGVTIPGSLTLRPKSSKEKAREIETERLIPWPAIVAVDLLPEDFVE